MNDPTELSIPELAAALASKGELLERLDADFIKQFASCDTCGAPAIGSLCYRCARG